MSYRRRDTKPPFGLNFLRPAVVQMQLGIQSDSLSRARPHLHRMELANGTTIYHVNYIGGLVLARQVSPDKRPIVSAAEDYARSPHAKNAITTAEEGFAEALAEAAVGGLISAHEISRLLGFQRSTVVHDWAVRPELLPPITNDAHGVADLWFDVERFQNFAQWARPGIDEPKP